MKNLTLVLLIAIFTIACNRDRLAPTIVIPVESFCTSAGGTIEVTVNITEENILREVVLTAPDLDFMQSIPGADIQDADGIFTALFSIDPNTPNGDYIMTVQAIDEFDNSSTKEISIKIA